MSIHKDGTKQVANTRYETLGLGNLQREYKQGRQRKGHYRKVMKEYRSIAQVVCCDIQQNGDRDDLGLLMWN